MKKNKAIIIMAGIIVLAIVVVNITLKIENKTYSSYDEFPEKVGKIAFKTEELKSIQDVCEVKVLIEKIKQMPLNIQAEKEKGEIRFTFLYSNHVDTVFLNRDSANKVIPFVLCTQNEFVTDRYNIVIK